MNKTNLVPIIGIAILILFLGMMQSCSGDIPVHDKNLCRIYGMAVSDPNKSFAEKNHAQGGGNTASLQEAQFNFDRYVREKEEAEALSRRHRVLIIVLMTVIVGLSVYILNKKLRQNAQLAAIGANKIKSDGRQNLVSDHRDANYQGNNDPADDISYFDSTIACVFSDLKSGKIEDVRKMILEKIQGIVSADISNRGIDRKLKETPAYRDLQGYIIREKVISGKSPLWMRLEDVINEVYPDFFENLSILSGGDLSKDQNRMAMLIKYGVTPTEMKHILGKTKGTISYHRISLMNKLMNQKLPTTILDDIIQML